MARILVIDDETNIRLMVRLALQHVGHEVITAADGADGLDRFADGAEWDVVLLDHRMPGLTGLEVLMEMRRRCPTARVVMITAFGTIDLAEEAIRAGAADFLRKPFTAEMLRDAVTSALSESDLGPGAGEAAYTSGLNGYRIASSGDNPPVRTDGVQCDFTVRTPGGEPGECAVLLAPNVVEELREHAAGATPDEVTRLWRSISEEALANYVWQNAQIPAARLLRVDDLTASMRRRMDTALAWSV